MTIAHTLLYPQTAQLNFDYYVNTHMKMASEYFDKSILVSWEVFKLPADSPYCAQVTTIWDSEEKFLQAMGTEKGKKLHADLVNCSKEAPLILKREFVGASE